MNLPLPNRMPAHVSVGNVSKVFALAEPGSGPVSLREALRTGRRETVHREVNALRDVSFEIGEGERVGIIGRNGAGKTTLLSLLAGITSPTSGTIETSGDIHAMLTVGAVLREDMTGRENIYLDGTVHGRKQKDIEAHVEEVISFVDLGDFIDRPVRTYSTGMKGRLAFAMGAFIDPDVLIIDETLSVGDAFFADRATQRMKEITAQGRIVILVSHSLRAIDEICNRCIWLDDGKVVMDGPAGVVTKAYQDAVEQADEAELAAKFGAADTVVPRAAAGMLAGLAARQNGTELTASARVLVPLEISVFGELRSPQGQPDLELSVLRVDGRRLLSQRLTETGPVLPQTGPFVARAFFDPLLLGAGLYRFEIALIDDTGRIDLAYRVLELVDEHGQFGGVPLLYCAPAITARAIGESS